MPSGLICSLLKFYAPDLPSMEAVVNNGAWNGFNVLVGFLIIFRTSQSYTRFWDGCCATKKMGAEWWSACSALVAFCNYSNATEQEKRVFQGTAIRLFSMLHAAAWAYIEDTDATDANDVEAFKFDLIDPAGIDGETLMNLGDDSSKVELIYQWIQLLIVDYMKKGVLDIPAPVLSRAFQELANGIVAFQDASKLTDTPFPFPYAQMCETALIFHWLMVPFVVYGWVLSPFWAGALSFVQVFVLWSINFTSLELENPFGMDPNDLEGRSAQKEMNRRLCILTRPHAQSTPFLTDDAVDYHNWEDETAHQAKRNTARNTLHSIWGSSDSNENVDTRHERLKFRTSRSAMSLDVNREASICSMSSSGSMASRLRSMSSSGIGGNRRGSRRLSAQANSPGVFQYSLPAEYFTLRRSYEERPSDGVAEIQKDIREAKQAAGNYHQHEAALLAPAPSPTPTMTGTTSKSPVIPQLAFATLPSEGEGQEINSERIANRPRDSPSKLAIV